MKKYNLFKIILICLATFMLASWILPTSEGTTIGENINRIGIYNFMNAIITSMRSFVPYVIFLIMVGFFYIVLNKTGVYEKMVDKTANMFKKKKALFVIIITALLAIISSVTNFGIILFILIPFIISILVKLGYDKLVCFSATFGAIFVGIIGSTLGGNITYNLIKILKVDFYDNILATIGLLIISTTLLILYTLNHIKKVGNKKNEELIVEDKFLIKDDTKSEVKNKSVITLSILFGVVILLVTLTSIVWATLFKVTIFDSFFKSVMEFKVLGFQLFGSIIGSDLAGGYLSGARAFGHVGYEDMTLLLSDLSVLLFISTAVIGFIYKVKFSEMLTAIKDGAKKVSKSSFLIVFALTLLIFNYYVPIMNTVMIYSAKSFNIITSSLTFVIASITNIDMLFLANGNLEIYISAVANTSLHPVIHVMAQSIYGLTMFVAPTSILLILGLTYLDIKYTTWVKYIWKLLIQILVAILIVLLLLMVL